MTLPITHNPTPGMRANLALRPASAQELLAAAESVDGVDLTGGVGPPQRGLRRHRQHGGNRRALDRSARAGPRGGGQRGLSERQPVDQHPALQRGRLPLHPPVL